MQLQISVAAKLTLTRMRLEFPQLKIYFAKRCRIE